METSVIEKDYPVTFREDDARELGKQLAHRHSVDLVGMKRVGISNFLRFFLYNQAVVPTYIHPSDKYLFVPIDLNDLVEREIFPFWALTMKRIVDAVGRSKFSDLDKKQIESLFLSSIQTQDLFLLIDSVRRLIGEIVSHDITISLFFLRFDRMKDVVTPSFFDNLQGLKDAANQKLVYVFTGDRSLDVLSPSVFPKASLSVFSKVVSMKPANQQDTKIIYETYKNRYNLALVPAVEEALLHLVNGYVQYLQLALIILNEKKERLPASAEDLFATLSHDERIVLQSEELWESLTKEEKDVLMKVAHATEITADDKAKAPYLWDCGFVVEKEGKQSLFSELFAAYLRVHDEGKQESHMVHFSKKEHLLYTLLEQHTGEICEREKIVETVWPEYSEFGVSDWAIDRLVARVRSKLKQQKSPLEIVTIRTRGYKLAPHE